MPERPALRDQDASLDRYARLVHRALDVPTALVSVCEPDRQLFPGLFGLAEPWVSLRETPLTHSFCQYVVADAAPLVVADARLTPRLAQNLAIRDLGVVAYAGYPLTDADGLPIGSLAAIDVSPRQWASADLALLADLADACSAELRHRTATDRAARGEQQALADGRIARVLLSLSEQLGSTITLTDIAAALHRIAVHELDALHAGIWMVDGGCDDGSARHVENPALTWQQARDNATLPVDDGSPIGHAIGHGTAGYYAHRDDQDAQYPGLAADRYDDDGQSRAYLPLITGGETIGCLVIVWPELHPIDMSERVTLDALTSYTAQAAQRAQLLAERVSVATTLQTALLTPLPAVPGLELATRYRAAAAAEHIGGDWYDVIARPDDSAALLIGDVIGHDIAAATLMGQLRSMQRAFVWQASDSPSQVMTRLDRSARDLGLGVLATSALAVLSAGPGERTLCWTSAGHPSPAVADPAGRCRLLDADPIDPLIGAQPDAVRHENATGVPPGSTVLLYTDGLIERRDGGIDLGRAQLLAALRRHHRLPLEELVDAVLDELTDERSDDDVAVLAVRTA